MSTQTQKREQDLATKKLLPSVKKSRGAKNESVLLSKSLSVQSQRKATELLAWLQGAELMQKAHR